MGDRKLSDVLDCEFRSNPGYEIVPLERMTGEEQEALARLREDPECFGILRPRPDSELRIKSVCKETALLFYAMQSGGKLPSSVLRELREQPEQANQQIVELVLSEVLQVSRNGDFMSGPRAHDLISAPAKLPEQLGRIARLSLEAVKYGQRLAIEDPLRLSAQMYFFNRLPVTPQWKQRIGDPGAFSRFLGIDGQGRCAELLRTIWKKAPDSPEMVGWNSWLIRTGESHRKARLFDFKIYVSPALDSMPDVLPAMLEVFAKHRVQQFKIGADLPGLTRPDKIVAYLEDFDHLENVGHNLAERLGNVPVHGVPFTAELCCGGLISWGMDPHETALLDWHERTSWRLWITNRLAAALLDARHSKHSEVEPWRFALQRLRLDGVDTDTWTPTHVYQERTRS
jgi:hypothetical protein